MRANIAILEGDGVGPEIVREGVKVLSAIEKRFGHNFNCKRTPFGAGAFFNHGLAFPDESKKVCDEADTILKGPVGLALSEMKRIPVNQRPELAILELRERYNTFANYRPVILPPQLSNLSPLRQEIIDRGINILMIRELVGGIYFGKKTEGEETKYQSAIDECIYSRQEIEQVTETAFRESIKLAAKLTVVHKANILATSRLWQKIVEEIGNKFPQVQYEFILVDNAAFQLSLNPSKFNGVMLLENMQGDILSDQAGGIVGSLGLMCSACIGPEKSYFEPVHGSAPDIAGLNQANPFSLIGSVAMLLEKSFNLTEESTIVWNALWEALKSGRVTKDLSTKFDSSSLSTSEFGNVIVDLINKPSKSIT